MRPVPPTAMAATLPTLDQWTKDNFIPLISSPSTIQESYRRFFPNHPTITLNGVHVTPGGYTAILKLEFGQDTSASVNIENMVVVPTTAGSQAAGTVGFFFTAIVSQGSSSRTVTSSVNAVIEQDQSIQDSENVDKRRVTTMTQVILDNGTNPVNMLTKA